MQNGHHSLHEHFLPRKEDIIKMVVSARQLDLGGGKRDLAEGLTDKLGVRVRRTLKCPICS